MADDKRRRRLTTLNSRMHFQYNERRQRRRLNEHGAAQHGKKHEVDTALASQCLLLQQTFPLFCSLSPITSNKQRNRKKNKHHLPNVCACAFMAAAALHVDMAMWQRRTPGVKGRAF